MGNHSLKIGQKNGTPAPPAPVVDWQEQMRAALMESVTPDDIRQIAQNLVGKAKEGDKKAIDLLFRYVLGNSSVHVKRAVILNGSPPTQALPGSSEKLRVIEARVSKGLPVNADGDAEGYGGLD